MSNERASIFGDDLDVSGFSPKPAKPEEVRAVAESTGFRSREPAPTAAAVEPVKREQRRYRTGRNQQLSLKVKAEDVAEFYALADAEGVVLGEAFARAVAAWKREKQGRG